MDKPVRDVTKEYEEAEAAAANFNPGEQPDIAALMRSAFVHGYAQALIDYPDIETAAELAADVEDQFSGDGAETPDSPKGCTVTGPRAYSDDKSRPSPDPAVEKQRPDDCVHLWERVTDTFSVCSKCGRTINWKQDGVDEHYPECPAAPNGPFGVGLCDCIARAAEMVSEDQFTENKR